MNDLNRIPWLHQKLQDNSRHITDNTFHDCTIPLFRSRLWLLHTSRTHF